ncbi:MAG: hypothetical protein IJT41_07910 [Clostridia bacterium]|nr:hypothetical protein [Clostridia bacterium]
MKGAEIRNGRLVQNAVFFILTVCEAQKTKKLKKFLQKVQFGAKSEIKRLTNACLPAII